MKQTGTEIEQNWARMGGKVNPLGIVQEIEIRLYYQMVHAQTIICPGERDIKFSGTLRYKRWPDIELINKTKQIKKRERTGSLMDFAVPAYPRV